MGKNAAARAEAEWIWDARPSGSTEELLAWLTEQLGHVASREKAAQVLLPRAAADGPWAAVELLVAEGARIDGEALGVALSRRDHPLLRRLCAAGGDVDDVDGVGVGGPAIFHAILGGDREAVEVLLDAGANIEIEYVMTMGRPLMWAAFLGNRAMVELLLERGADPRGYYDGDTAESLAAGRGHEEIAEVLRQAGERGAESVP